MIRQFKLQTGDGPELATMVTFLPDDTRLKIGTQLTLHQKPEVWTIIERASQSHSIAAVKQTWSNNI